jgi:transmembrane sensor
VNSDDSISPSSAPRPPARRSPFDWARESGLGAELAQEIRQEARARQARRRAVVGGLSLVLLVATALWQFSAQGGGEGGGATRNMSRVLTPEKRVLPDGSEVELRAGAEMVVDFSSARRQVVLVRGEGHFDVAKDPARPFVVVAGGVEVQAIGTVFAVERDAHLVDVVVTEGRVAVRTAGALTPSSAPVAVSSAAFVDAGSRTTVPAAATFSVAPTIVPLSATQLGERLAWRVPRLEFDAAPLDHVVARLVEHGGLKLQLADSSLRAVKVSGILRANNVDALAQLLAADHNIVVEPQSSGVLLLRRK